MFEFIYHIRFYIHLNLFNIRIYASLEDYVTPVFISSYDDAVLTNKEEFIFVYHEIKNYFEQKYIQISKEDLRLFYYTLSQFNMPLPTMQKILVKDIDSQLIQLKTLTPKEFLFLMYIDGKSVNGKKAQYWFDEYQVDVEFLTQTLESRGYLTTQDYLYNLEHSTRIEIEDVLIQNKCPVTGSRIELINRLKDELTDATLEQAFNGLYIALTPKGIQEVQNLAILSEFHKSHYRLSKHLSIDEFYLLHKLKPHYITEDLCKILIVNQNADQLKFFEWQDVFHEPKQKAYSPFVIEDDFESILSKYEEEPLGEDEVETLEIKLVEGVNQINKLKQKYQKTNFIEAHMIENQANLERIELEQENLTEILLTDILKDSELIIASEENIDTIDQALDDFYKIITKFSQPKEDIDDRELTNLNARMKLNTDDFFGIINKESTPVNQRLIKNEAALAEAIEEVTAHPKHSTEKSRSEERENIGAHILEEEHKLDILIDEPIIKRSLFKRLFTLEFGLSSLLSILILYLLYYFVF
jgi:hypothetical protein